jgi:hypothetical protein
MIYGRTRTSRYEGLVSLCLCNSTYRFGEDTSVFCFLRDDYLVNGFFFNVNNCTYVFWYYPVHNICWWYFIPTTRRLSYCMYEAETYRRTCMTPERTLYEERDINIYLFITMQLGLPVCSDWLTYLWNPLFDLVHGRPLQFNYITIKVIIIMICPGMFWLGTMTSS